MSERSMPPGSYIMCVVCYRLARWLKDPSALRLGRLPAVLAELRVWAAARGITDVLIIEPALVILGDPERQHLLGFFSSTTLVTLDGVELGRRMAMSKGDKLFLDLFLARLRGFHEAAARGDHAVVELKPEVSIKDSRGRGAVRVNLNAFAKHYHDVFGSALEVTLRERRGDPHAASRLQRATEQVQRKIISGLESRPIKSLGFVVDRLAEDITRLARSGATATENLVQLSTLLSELFEFLPYKAGSFLIKQLSGSNTSSLSDFALCLLEGLRHALDADHESAAAGGLLAVRLVWCRGFGYKAAHLLFTGERRGTQLLARALQRPDSIVADRALEVLSTLVNSTLDQDSTFNELIADTEAAAQIVARLLDRGALGTTELEVVDKFLFTNEALCAKLADPQVKDGASYCLSDHAGRMTHEISLGGSTTS
jgi:hypothetical protein